MGERAEGMLSPYRVLDLTDEKGWMCGKLLGDLGADVIKIEPPGGDPGRRIGPFYHDEPHPEKSLYWFAFNTGKRSITLNINTVRGQEILKTLVETADFVIESFQLGYLDKFSLGYPDLEKVNPRIIMVSITPFGQTGPYKDYKASDIVLWALGGYLYRGGDVDRSPVGVSGNNQSYLHAGAEAAAAAVMALYFRRLTGEGQQINVSIQECVAGLNVPSTASWTQKGVVPERGGLQINQAGNTIRRKSIWACKDGLVDCQLSAGPLALRVVTPLLEWMNEEGMLGDFLKEFDWVAWSFDTTCQEEIDRVNEPISRFLKTYTVAELLEGAIKRRVMLYPVSTVADIAKCKQLASRNFWSRVEHPELGTTITYPGAFIKSTEAPLRIPRRAPLIGEHNQEIYKQELGISKAELVALTEAGVI